MPSSSYAAFRRALDVRNPTLALTAAAELPRLSLTDALALVLLLRDREPSRYDRAAARWVSRYARELPGVDLGELLAVAAIFAAASPAVTASALEAIFAARKEQSLAEVVRRWRAGHD